MYRKNEIIFSEEIGVCGVADIVNLQTDCSGAAEEIDFVIDGEDEVEASDAVCAYFENDKTNN